MISVCAPGFGAGRQRKPPNGPDYPAGTGDVKVGTRAVNPPALQTPDLRPGGAAVSSPTQWGRQQYYGPLGSLGGSGIWGQNFLGFFRSWRVINSVLSPTSVRSE